MSRNFIFGLMTLFIAYILSPFLTATGMGAIFAVLFYPLMKRIHKGHFPDSLAAALFTLGVTLLIFLPIITIFSMGISTGMEELKRVKKINVANGSTSSSDGTLDQMFASEPVQKVLVRFSKITNLDTTQTAKQLKEITGNLASRLGDVFTFIVGSIPQMLVMFSIFLFSLYYFLADGSRFIQVIRKYSFFPPLETEKLFKTFSGLCNSVILASVISGAVQAIIAVSVCFFAGVQQLTTIFLVVFICSFIPLVGTFPIIISMAAYQFTGGHDGVGWTLTITAVVVATVDNLIRPQIIRGNSNLHPLLGFASALGGLQVFGIVGIFLGPVLCGLFLEIARNQLKGQKSEIPEILPHHRPADSVLEQ